MLTSEQEELQETITAIKKFHRQAQKIAKSDSRPLDDTEQPIIINDHMTSIALGDWQYCSACLQMISKKTKNITQVAIVCDLLPIVELHNRVISRLSAEKKELMRGPVERARDMLVQMFSSSDEQSSTESIPKKTGNNEGKGLNKEDVFPTCWQLLQMAFEKICGYETRDSSQRDVVIQKIQL